LRKKAVAKQPRMVSTVSAKRIAVVGAGVNGVSIATACASLGHEVHLFDESMPFDRTSSASSRMLHGGIRYIEQGHIGLVREALIERDGWLRFAPNATRVERFYFPVYQGSKRGRWLLFAGTLIYQLLAGRFSVGTSQLHSSEDLKHVFPNLIPQGLCGGASYCDVVMEYEPLIQCLVHEARKQGVRIIANTRIERLYSDGRIDTANQTLEFDRVINAAGPWAAQLLEDSHIESDFTIDHVRGSHLIVKASFPHALVLQAPSERRIIFVIPLDAEHVLLGTTEQKHDLPDPIVCTDAESAYLLEILNQHLSDPLSESHIVSSFAGVRPIVRPRGTALDDVSSASRDSEVEITDRLITVFGGKWTSARHLGEKVAALV
jgi:glycerol-3-phosphate dehydrogenase